MNCFTHALPFLDDPYFSVGCCLPDWLSAADRKCRAREKNALKWVDDSDPVVASIAKGVVQHHTDDAWFHQTPAFNDLILNFSVEVRAIFGKEKSMRPRLFGHILVELLIDAFLNKKFPGRMEYFYEQVEAVNGTKIQDALNRFATKPTQMLVGYMELFKRERYLFDYSTDEGVIYRINRVFQRVKLQPMGKEILDWVPQARQRVYDRIPQLLSKYVVEL